MVFDCRAPLFAAAAVPPRTDARVCGGRGRLPGFPFVSRGFLSAVRPRPGPAGGGGSRGELHRPALGATHRAWVVAQLSGEEAVPVQKPSSGDDFTCHHQS